MLTKGEYAAIHFMAAIIKRDGIVQASTTKSVIEVLDLADSLLDKEESDKPAFGKMK
jgi:hypothetical protein